ncbi:hypothetical protein [Streptomyces sp. R35]|uniref:Isochorismatase-like domain-containing protein n=1 Tax=Streptomyces sp. R35 TaxID=3238630 RepID=A0AB39SIC8_9ACTN
MRSHVCLIVFGDQATYLLGGDSTYDQDLLDAELTDGVNNSPRQAIESLRKIKEFARQHDVVVLPAHDPRAARRLADSETFRPSPGRA